jgi:FkbM family methyltransferase
MEIGAGWGPWISASGVLARRKQLRKTTLIAFEADADRFNAMRQHLSLNDLVAATSENTGSSRSVDWHLINAAADYTTRTVYWPAGNGVKDAGKSISMEATSTSDYRGHNVSLMPIVTHNISDVLLRYKHLDYVHVDIQGFEYDLLSHVMPALSKTVRCLFLGTHSRYIEGQLLDLFRHHGWQLLRERPRRFRFDSVAPSLTGMTSLDGAQLWLNQQKFKP